VLREYKNKAIAITIAMTIEITIAIAIEKSIWFQGFLLKWWN
jgi:hypothetical protein